MEPNSHDMHDAAGHGSPVFDAHDHDASSAFDSFPALDSCGDHSRDARDPD